MVIRIANYLDGLDPSGKYINKSKKGTCLEITGYRVKYSTVLWLLQLQIRRGRKVQVQVRTVNSNSRNSDCQCSLFSKKKPIIRIFCVSGWFAVPMNPDKSSSTVHCHAIHSFCLPVLPLSPRDDYFHMYMQKYSLHI